MSTRFNQLFGSNLITNQVVQPAGGLPAGFPTGFLSATKNVNGNMTSWDVIGDTRETGTITGYGNPATRVNLQQKAKGKAILLHTLNEIGMGQDILNEIVGENGDIDEKGVEEVARQAAQCAQRLMNGRVASIISMLAGSSIYVASDGQIVDSTYSGAVLHADLGIPAANTGTLGGIITAKWDIAGTLIATQVENMQRQRVINGTPLLKYAAYGPGVMDALLGNTIVSKMLQASNVKVNTATGLIEGLFDMTWYPVTGNFLKSSSAGAFTNPFAKKICFHPEPSRDWYELHQGSYVIGGNGLPAMADGASAIAKALQKVRGAFAFAAFQGNPLNIVHTFGDTWLPVLYQPSAMYIPTVLT